jgi:hypothetical protein
VILLLTLRKRVARKRPETGRKPGNPILVSVPPIRAQTSFALKQEGFYVTGIPAFDFQNILASCKPGLGVFGFRVLCGTSSPRSNFHRTAHVRRRARWGKSGLPKRAMFSGPGVSVAPTSDGSHWFSAAPRVNVKMLVALSPPRPEPATCFECGPQVRVSRHEGAP